MKTNLHPVFYEICESIKRGSQPPADLLGARFNEILNGIDAALGFEPEPRNPPPRCTVERFTHGDRVAEPCGCTDDVMICSECGNAFCRPCRQSHAVCAVAGKPVCESCLYPEADNFELWGENSNHEN